MLVRLFTVSMLSLVATSAFGAEKTTNSASETGIYCASYNEYVDGQCISKLELSKTVVSEISKTYSVKSCKSEALLTILESDEIARGLCEPVVKKEQIEKLQARNAN